MKRKLSMDVKKKKKKKRKNCQWRLPLSFNILFGRFSVSLTLIKLVSFVIGDSGKKKKFGSLKKAFLFLFCVNKSFFSFIDNLSEIFSLFGLNLSEILVHIFCMKIHQIWHLRSPIKLILYIKDMLINFCFYCFCFLGLQEHGTYWLIWPKKSEKQN